MVSISSLLNLSNKVGLENCIIRGAFKKFPEMGISQSPRVRFNFETDDVSKIQSFGEFFANNFKNDNTIEC